MRTTQDVQKEVEQIFKKELNDLLTSRKSKLNELNIDDNITMVNYNILVKMINQFGLNLGLDKNQYKPANRNQHLRKIPKLVIQEIENHKTPLFTEEVKRRCYLTIMEDFRKEPLSKGQSLNIPNVVNYIIKNCLQNN